MSEVTRRGLTTLVGLATASAAVRAPAAASSLVLVTPQDQLHAFLKVYTSLEKLRVWYWYTGVIDAWTPDCPVVPVVGVDTLIRRDMTPLGDDRYAMEMFEGSYFHPVDDPTPSSAMINPLSGREVHPFHYREGPYQAVYTDRGSYSPPESGPPADAPPFSVKWGQAEDQVWFSRDYYIDTPHPFPMARWPMESSGPRQTVGSFASHFASRREVADPAVKTARSAFHYEAFMNWLPWLLMGQTPGRMVWRAAGLKLSSLSDLAPSTRAGFLATHPGLFQERPWSGFSNMAIDYQRLRTPAPRS